MLVIAALYKFATLPDYQLIHHELKKLTAEQGLRGTLLVAKEGINGTVAGTRAAIDTLLDYCARDERFLAWEYKESYAEKNPFARMKVKLKKEIVTLGRPEADPSKMVGTYVSPQQFNELLRDPEFTLIDVRNNYEVELGTFKHAINPKTDYFREFPAFVSANLDPQHHKKIAMVCTGGIRCEKASSYMKTQGFEQVYHLKGGILKYLEETPEQKSLWQGECFVFDNRVTVDHQLRPGHYALCHGCRQPISPADMASEQYEKGVRCPKCYQQRSLEQVASAKQRQLQIDLAKSRGTLHITS